jgi:hypothetical protein
MHTLLDDGPASVVLQVEQVAHVHGHHNPTGVEVWALQVTHGHEALLPLRVLLIVDREECDRHGGGGSNVALTQGGEGNMCHLLDGIICLATDNGSYPWCHGVEGYVYLNLTPIQAMGLK